MLYSLGQHCNQELFSSNSFQDDSSSPETEDVFFVLSEFPFRARLVDYLFPMSKVLKIRVDRSVKKKEKKKAEVPIIGCQMSLFVTEMLPMPWQEVQICVHDVHETYFLLYYSSACSYRKLCRFEKC